LALASIYGCIFLALEGLRFAPRWDEPDFWNTTLSFLEQSQPWWERLRSYNLLSTPLAFLIFSGIEGIFHGGIFGGRLLNFFLSVGVALTIGFSRGAVSYRSAAAALALIGFPYFLFVGTHLYNEMVAVAFGLGGIWCHRRNWPFLSALAFILAISARQYMVAFPAAIFLAEVARSWRGERRVWHAEVLLPLAAVLSLLAWFLFFGGMAPSAAFGNLEIRVPQVQQRALAIDVGSSLYFLGILGIYFVIPEWALYRRTIRWRRWVTQRNVTIALVLLILFVFTPMRRGHGIFNRAVAMSHLPLEYARNLLLFLPALAAVIRFSRLHIGTWLVFTHAVMMAKAYPWDKYLLPLLVVLWYLESYAPEEIGATATESKDSE